MPVRGLSPRCHWLAFSHADIDGTGRWVTAGWALVPFLRVCWLFALSLFRFFALFPFFFSVFAFPASHPAFLFVLRLDCRGSESCYSLQKVMGVELKKQEEAQYRSLALVGCSKTAI